MTRRVRLDVLLVERSLCESRSRAQALIRAGQVTVDGRLEDKPGTPVRLEAEVSVAAPDPFVSRGAHKLVGALEAFGVEPAGRVCLDVGASTGGFTDLLLQRGALRVYAVDVGRGQLAWRLRQDPRVVCMERTDIRDVDALPDRPDLATVDVAFISVRRVLPAIAPLLGAGGRVLTLVKPQFEAGREWVGRGGIVRDSSVHRAVLSDLLEWARESGWHALDAAPSPITGASGNREFWLLLAPPGERATSLSDEEAITSALGGADGA